MALVNPQIAMSYRPTVEYQPRNALAEYAQIQNIVGGQRQAEVADMQLESLRRERDALGQIQAAIVAKGGPPDLEAAADAMIKTGRPEFLTQGMAIRTALRNQREAEAYRRDYGVGAAPANAMVAPAAAAAPTAAPVPQGELVAAPILPSTGTVREIAPGGAMGAPMPLAANALAPAAAPAAPINALAAAPVVAAATAAPDANALRLRTLEAQYRRIGNNPELANEKALILKQIEDVQATIRSESATPPEAKFMRVLGIPLTREGFVEFEALKQRPGEFERLLSQSGLPKADQTALIQQRLRKEATHAPGTTVNVSTEKKYGERFGGLIAEQDAGKLSVAEKAPQLAASANRIIGLVQQGNVFTGPAADIKLNIARALNVAGASNQERIANTENLIAATGQSTLDAIKGAGLGTGQGFTNKDLVFLQGVAGGTINLTPQTLTELARLQHLTATRGAEAWNKRVREIPKDVIQGTGLSTTPIVVPPLASTAKKPAPTAAVPPAPAGMDADIWNAMTPQERSLWQK